MYAVTTIFDQQTLANSSDVWKIIDDVCGISNNQSEIIPHFSWHVAKGYETDGLGIELTVLAEKLSCFKINITGIGVFTGENPIVYLNIIKSRVLYKTQQIVWKTSDKYSSTSNMLYQPDYWMPHITVAYRDVKPGRLFCVIKELASKSIDFMLPVNNLAIIYQSENAVGIKEIFPLRKK